MSRHLHKPVSYTVRRGRTCRLAISREKGPAVGATGPKMIGQGEVYDTYDPFHYRLQWFTSKLVASFLNNSSLFIEVFFLKVSPFLKSSIRNLNLTEIWRDLGEKQRFHLIEGMSAFWTESGQYLEILANIYMISLWITSTEYFQKYKQALKRRWWKRIRGVLKGRFQAGVVLRCSVPLLKMYKNALKSSEWYSIDLSQVEGLTWMLSHEL